MYRRPPVYPGPPAPHSPGDDTGLRSALLGNRSMCAVYPMMYYALYAGAITYYYVNMVHSINPFLSWTHVGSFCLQLSPFDLIPEAVFGMLGMCDDLIVMLIALLYLAAVFRQFYRGVVAAYTNRRQQR